MADPLRAYCSVYNQIMDVKGNDIRTVLFTNKEFFSLDIVPVYDINIPL